MFSDVTYPSASGASGGWQRSGDRQRSLGLHSVPCELGSAGISPALQAVGTAFPREGTFPLVVCRMIPGNTWDTAKNSINSARKLLFLRSLLSSLIME